MEFGLLEAIWWPHVDIWLRYSSIVSSIKPLTGKDVVSVLDVGAGENILSWFLQGLNIEATSSDIDLRSLRHGAASVTAVAADGCRLPFRSQSFDIVVSSGALEHVPSSKRAEFLEEMVRVARRRVILYVPVDEEPLYRSRWTDLVFAAEHKRTYGFAEKNTEEHIAAGGWVGLSLLKRHLEGASFTPMHNCHIWLRHMLMSMRPDPLLMLNGFYYLFVLKKNDDRAPYYACKVVYDKESTEASG